MKNRSLFSSFTWRILEQFSISGVQFVLQIILARLLAPEHYGILSIVVIFTSLASIFIQSGFNTALIQNKDVTEEDYSSVLWVSLGVAVVIYGVLFFFSPLIARFYNMPEIVWPLRILSLMLVPGALNSVQLAKVSREMDFRKVFTSNIGAIAAYGIVGIILAYLGYGIWALVIGRLVQTCVATAVMWGTVKWRPRFICNISRIKILLSYGWKLLISNLLDTLYQDLRSLVIGKKYDSGTLGYYNRGKQFPQFLINAINGAVQSVMLPAMSAKQDDPREAKALMRRSITMSAFLVFPMMTGLAVVAPALVKLLLTDKWLPCVPYMQIYCFSLAFYPVHSCNLQAINAMGRSDIFLKLEIIKKAIGISLLVIAVFCFDSPIAIAMTGLFTTAISFLVNAYPNRKLVGYSYAEQIWDLLPVIGISVLMGGAVYGISFLNVSPIVTLLIQMPMGIVIYFLLAKVLRVESFSYLLNMGNELLKNKNKRAL